MLRHKTSGVWSSFVPDALPDLTGKCSHWASILASLIKVDIYTSREWWSVFLIPASSFWTGPPMLGLAVWAIIQVLVCQFVLGTDLFSEGRRNQVEGQGAIWKPITVLHDGLCFPLKDEFRSSDSFILAYDGPFSKQRCIIIMLWLSVMKIVVTITCNLLHKVHFLYYRLILETLWSTFPQVIWLRIWAKYCRFLGWNSQDLVRNSSRAWF